MGIYFDTISAKEYAQVLKVHFLKFSISLQCLQTDQDRV